MKPWWQFGVDAIFSIERDYPGVHRVDAENATVKLVTDELANYDLALQRTYGATAELDVISRPL